VTFEMHSSVSCFKSANVCGLFLHTFFFKNPKHRNPVAMDPGIEGGHKFREIMRPPKNSLNIYIIEFAVCTLCLEDCILYGL
jgi:hypothetical protein